MSGASINRHTGLWKKKSGKYLFSHKALATVFRAKLLQALAENKLPVPHDCPEQWVVDCKGAGNGEEALIYLNRYLIQRPAIICLACRAAMVIIATRITRPRARPAIFYQHVKPEALPM